MRSKSSAARRKALDNRRDPVVHGITLAEDDQEYAKVTRLLGNNRVLAKASDGSERHCRIRGSMRRRVWVHVGDIVLVASRDLAGEQVDIVYKYSPAEVAWLRRHGEAVAIAADDDEAGTEDFVSFAGGDDDCHIVPEQQKRRPEMPPDEDSEEEDLDWDKI